MADARKARAEQIAALAARNFAEHRLELRLEQGLYRSWRCAKPGTCVYGFTVTTTPGHLFVTGDLGDLILSREADMIPWLRGAVRDPQYLASKVSSEMEAYEFDPDVAKEWLREELAGGDARFGAGELGRLDEIAESDGEHAFFAELYQELGYSDLPQLRNFTHTFLWHVEALKLFLRLLDAAA